MIVETRMFPFPFNRPVAMEVLLLIMTIILTVTSNQEFKEVHYKSLGPGYTYAYLQASPTEQFSSTRSLLECTVLSLNSQSQFFTYNNVSHVCKNYSPKNIMTVVSTNDNNEISFFRRSQWIKVYALTMRAGSKVYNSYMNIGSPSTWNVEKCVDTYCPNFFRHPILDFWNHLPIDEVKLVIYEGQTDVVNMVFDGRNTTFESWFSHEMLKSSPWPDLLVTTANVFSIVGGAVRRFYVSHKFGGCIEDWAWMFISDATHMCYYEKLSRYPQILYSKRNSKTLWDGAQGKGDSVAIFIRLKSN